MNNADICIKVVPPSRFTRRDAPSVYRVVQGGLSIGTLERQPGWHLESRQTPYQVYRGLGKDRTYLGEFTTSADAVAAIIANVI